MQLSELVADLEQDVITAESKFSHFQEYIFDGERIASRLEINDLNHMALDVRLKSDKLRKLRELQAEETSIDSEKHELIKWLEDLKSARGDQVVIDHFVPLSVPVDHNPSSSAWHHAALRFVSSGSIEDYNEMLSLVRLTHPIPNLWNESETSVVNKGFRRTGPLTPAWVWNNYQPELWALAIMMLCCMLSVLLVSLF